MRKSMLLYVQCTVPYFPSGHTFASAACGFILSQWEKQVQFLQAQSQSGGKRAAVHNVRALISGPMTAHRFL